MIVGKPELVEQMAAKVKEIVSTVKGGGKGGKWQGKVTQWQKGEIEALEKAVEWAVEVEEDDEEAAEVEEEET